MMLLMLGAFAPPLPPMLPPPLPLVDVDYCDDSVVPVVAPAPALVDKCVDIVYVACAVFTSYGLVLNVAVNKTNVMARFVGKGSVASKQELFYKGGEAVFVLFGVSICLKYVDAYKHMGTHVSFTHDLSQEVTTRAAIIRSSTNAIKSVLRNPMFLLDQKLTYVKAHLFSSGFFQCSTWGPLAPALYGKIHSAVIQVYRIATKHVFDPAAIQFHVF